MIAARGISRVCAALAVSALVAMSAHVAAQPRTATLYMRVAGADGTPAADVHPADVQLAVDGQPRQISSVAYLGGARRVMLLVANNVQAELNPLRNGLEQFIARIPSDDEIGLGTIAGQFQPRVEPARDRSRLLEFVKGLPIESGNNVVMDPIVEAGNRFLDREALQPVLVVIATEGSESSGVHDEVFNQFVQRFSARGGVAHAVIVSTSDGTLRQNADAESLITMNIAKSTGGRYELVNSFTAIPDKLKSIAADIAADEKATAGWYKVVFAADTPPHSVRVGLTRDDEKVQQLAQSRPKAK